jgi:hypothetical protein
MVALSCRNLNSAACVRQVRASTENGGCGLPKKAYVTALHASLHSDGTGPKVRAWLASLINLKGFCVLEKKERT